MQGMMAVLVSEKAKLEGQMRSAQTLPDAEKNDLNARLVQVNSDIERLEMYIDRPTMQTFSELLFVDDIRKRVELIIENRKK